MYFGSIGAKLNIPAAFLAQNDVINIGMARTVEKLNLKKKKMF